MGGCQVYRVATAPVACQMCLLGGLGGGGDGEGAAHIDRRTQKAGRNSLGRLLSLLRQLCSGPPLRDRPFTISHRRNTIQRKRFPQTLHNNVRFDKQYISIRSSEIENANKLNLSWQTLGMRE